MTVCDIKHDEICYEGRNCPLCNALEQIQSLEIIIKKLEDNEQ